MRPNRRLLSFLPLVLLCVAAVFGGISLQQGEDLLIQRKYREAAATLAAALPEVPVGEQDRVLLLLGEAQLLAGDAPAATATLQRLLSEQAGSALVPAARFLLARTYEAVSDRRRAAEVYRDEIERLTGFQRKDEVASVYLGLAEKAQQQDPPDHQRVVTFCDLALDLGLEQKRAAAIRLKAALAVLQLGQHQDAIARLVPLVSQLDVATGKLRAMLALGQARRLQGDFPGARTVLRDLQALAKDAPEAGDAGYEIALSYGVPAPAPAQLDRAVAALAELQRLHPSHPKARIASFLAAQCHAGLGRGDDALKALAAFLLAQADSSLDEVPAARAMVGDVLAGQGKITEAIAAWREYLALHPSHSDWERAQRAIVDAEWRLAVEAFRKGKAEFATARERLLAFARAYPLDERNPDVLFLFGDMLRQEEQYAAAREALARCVSKYPGKDQSSRAQYAIGEIFETKTFDYDQALAAYRAVTWGPMQGPAQRRIAALTQKHLHLRTERVFRSDEKPVFQLTSRNMETVRVRVFRLAMEDYFRATHQAGNVHQLDIEVISPDQTFDSAVPSYLRYRETERAVELPFKEPGAYVVKVDDKELEATTMVLVSDLALIAKSSRHEFLVFTQNTLHSRVAAGVKVVLSDGQKIVAEGVTSPEGIWRFAGEELKNRDDLRVFAVDASGSGASSLDLSGMGFSTGLLPKGYLFTDRPLYQPGQRVHWKGIVREVRGGVYQLPAADGYRVQVTSPSGRLVLQRDVQFTAFGTFATELDLPAAAELGDWRIAVDRPGHPEVAFNATFAVAKYERPRLQLAFELTEPVVCRGEPIRGRLRAQWYYGEPAAAREVVYRLWQPDGSVIERRGTTNAAGEVAIELPTGEFAEEALARIAAEMPADGVSAQVVVPVVTTEFAPVLAMLRQVYLADEPFEVTAKLFDRSNRPLQRDAVATLLRLERSARGDGALVETEVSSQNVRTGADGTARFTFAANKGGQYRVRLASTDRFGNVVTGDVQLTVSAADDEVRLRLLCDRETFRVGETAAVKVVNRAGKRLVLLTWQGDGVLACESRLLAEGESVLDLPIKPEHAPNFALAFAMVDGNKLHTAERPFTVQRDLRVEVVAPKTAVPGSEVEVTVRAQDPQGRPVRAEVALAMVDEALLAIHGERAPAIGPFFYGQLRETAFRTQSSCTWAYTGPSQRVNVALLAEEVRRELMAPKPAGAEAGDVVVAEVFSVFDEVSANAPALPMSRRFAAADDSERAGYIAGSDQFHLGASSRMKNAPQGNAIAVGDKALLLQGIGQGTGDVSALDLRGVLDFTSAGRAPMSLLASNEPRVDFRETGAWLSALQTGDDGLAKATIRLPDSTTGWRLTARAVTADTWVGEGSETLKTQKALQVDYVGPAQLTEGDTTELGVRVHNLGDEARRGRVALTQTFGPEPKPEAKTEERDVDLLAHGEASETFAFTASAAGALRLRLDGSAGDAQDRMELGVPVQPFGTEVVEGRSGSTRDRAAFTLGLPEGREFTALRMFVELGPDPGRDLVRAALGGGYQPRNCVQADATNLARSSRGLAALTVLDYLERGGKAGVVDRDRLLGQATALLQSLVGAQLPDGSYAWVGSQNQDLRSTCQVVRFLAACRQRGMPTAEEPLNKAAELLLQAVRTAGNEVRADVLWALAVAGRVRFESLNSLHRARTGMSADSLARLALAWQQNGRPELAAEVLETLRTALPAGAFARVTAETVALAARALLTGDPRDATATAAVDWLRAARRGAGWDTPEATTAAIAVLTLVQGSTAGAPRATEITVTVNGKELATSPPSAHGVESLFAVPAEWLRERGNEVGIAVAGGGEAFFSVALVGFQRGFRDEDKNDELVRVTRTYLAAPRRHGDRDVPSGFSVITGHGYRQFENTITQLGAGESGRVRVNFWVRKEQDRARMTPIVLEEPLPAGFAVPRASIEGGFDHVEVQPDRLVFYFRDGVSSSTVSYELQARFPGKYRALPPHVYSALRPELHALGGVGTLTVHARGQGARDDYRLTPDELFHLGKAEFDAAQAATGEARGVHVAAAQEHLARLLADWQKKDHRLQDEPYKEVARMMLFLGIELGDARQVVRFFEELKDRYADLVIPFDKILAVGRAYFDLGEFEAALLVFRATADASFLKDAAVATTLQSLGEHKAGTRFLEQLLAAYPDLPTMRVARYSIGQKLAAMAAAAVATAAVDERVGSAADLRRHALAAFREFLVRHPEDPLAEEVSFAWATTHLEGKELQPALAVAEAALLRYPQSAFQDELLYTVGYAQFALGEHEKAFAALERVATEKFPDQQGGVGESESKWHAVYLQGQIHHARGEPDKALAAYDRVQDRFTDAGEAMDYFRQRQLALPEVATFATTAAAELEISFRNIERVDVQVFQVDLMRLYLLERSLNDIRGIQLHGIQPLLAFAVELGTGRDYRSQTKKVPLELAEPGAYLAVVRGGDRIATGMVLKSDLRIEAQEQCEHGRMRVNVKQGDAFLAGAHVKVTASGGGDFHSGDTDLRGVFAADRLVGLATVIVQKDRQYAFYRGSSVHQPAVFRPAPEPGQQAQQIDADDVEKRKNARGFDALEQNFRYNDMNRGRQVEWLQNEVLNKQQKGVEVYRTK